MVDVVATGTFNWTLLTGTTGPLFGTRLPRVLEVNILQDTDDVETSAMDCASLRPNGEYLSNQVDDRGRRRDDRGRPDRAFSLRPREAPRCQEMDLVTCSTRVFARAKPEEKVWAQGWSISWHQSSTRAPLVPRYHQ